MARDAGIKLTGNSGVKAVPRSREKKPGSILPLIILLLAMVPLLGTRQGRAMLPFILIMLLSSGRGGGGGGFGGFGGGYGGFGGGLSGGGGASRGF